MSANPAAAAAAVVPFLNHGRRGELVKEIPFSPGAPESVELPRQYPIDRLMCQLYGTYNISGAATALKPFGVANLIESIEIRENSKDVVHHIDGRLLAFQTQINSEGRIKPLIVQPGTGVGTHNYEYHFEIPFKVVEPYVALLDATRSSELTIKVNCKQPEDAFDGGTMTHTGGMKIYTVAVAGGQPGQLGGPGYNYPRRVIDMSTQKIAAQQRDFTVSLYKSASYLRFMMLALEDGAPSNGILNAIKLKIGTTVLHVPPARMVQAEQVSRYGFDQSDITGLYCFDLTTHRDRINQMQAVADHALSFELLLDVNHPGTDDRILLVADKIIRRQNVA